MFLHCYSKFPIPELTQFTANLQQPGTSLNKPLGTYFKNRKQNIALIGQRPDPIAVGSNPNIELKFSNRQRVVVISLPHILIMFGHGFEYLERYE